VRLVFVRGAFSVCVGCVWCLCGVCLVFVRGAFSVCAGCV